MILHGNKPLVYKNNKPYVLEASNAVKLISLDDRFNKLRFGTCVIYRVFDKPIKIRYKKYLGQRRHINPDQLVVAPSDIANSKYPRVAN